MIELFIQRKKAMSMEAKMKAAEVRSVIEGKKDEILEQVKTRLAKFLPSWQPQQTEITFKIMEDADYRHPRRKGGCRSLKAFVSRGSCRGYCPRHHSRTFS